MDFSGMMDTFFSYAEGNTLILLALAACLLLLLYRKPKMFFGVLFLGLFLAGLFYLIMSLAGTGSERKKGLIFEEEKQTNSNR